MDPLQIQQGGMQPPMGADGKPVEMATPEQKQKLMDLIGKTRDKVGEFNAQSFASDNKIQSQKNDVLGQLFQMLQAAGIDLTDPRSISDFINQLKMKNPPMGQMFEDALNQLLGEDTEGGQEAPPQEQPMDPGLGGPPQGQPMTPPLM